MDEHGGSEEPPTGDRSGDGERPLPGAGEDWSERPAADRSGTGAGDDVGEISAMEVGADRQEGDGELGDFLGRASLQSPDEFIRGARARKGLNPSVLADDQAAAGSAATIGEGTGADRGGAAREHDEDGEAESSARRDGRGASADFDEGADSGASDGPDDAAGDDGAGDTDEGAGEVSGRSWRRWPMGPRPEIGVDKWNTGSVRRGPYSPGVAGIADVIDALEPTGDVDDVSLHAELVDLVRLRSRIDSAIARRCREWDQRGLWAGDGSKSPSARLARDANCSRSTAAGLVHLSRALARMPLTAVAFADGRISVDHVRRLVDACTDDRLALFAADEADLIAEAERLAGDFNGFRRIVRHWELIADDHLYDPTDPDAEPPGQKRARTGRDFRMPETPDGFDIRGSLTKADGAIAWNTFQQVYDELWEADWAEARAEHGGATTVEHLKRTVVQRRADAFVEMCRRAAAWKTGDAVARPLVTVLVNYEDLAGPIRETFNGTVLSRRDVAEWLTEADFERVVFGPKGQPVDITSPARFFTGALRRAVQVRDRICSHPTCDVDADRCQVDHVIEVVDGGPTSIDNARLLCPRHNQQRPGRGKKPPPSGRADDGGEGGDGAGGG